MLDLFASLLQFLDRRLGSLLVLPERWSWHGLAGNLSSGVKEKLRPGPRGEAEVAGSGLPTSPQRLDLGRWLNPDVIAPGIVGLLFLGLWEVAVRLTGFPLTCCRGRFWWPEPW
jgi:hypothetical protein